MTARPGSPLTPLDRGLTAPGTPRLAHAVSRELARIRRGGLPFTVLHLAVPGIREARTAYGTLFTEAADAEVLEAVRAAVRECDTIVPLGAGEVAVVLPETPGNGAEAVGARLALAVERAFAAGFLGRAVVPAPATRWQEPREVGAPLPGVDPAQTDRLTGLAGEHAFHIHAVGKCEPPFTTAGGHFNPAQHKHGFMSGEGHAGDMPNLHVPEGGALSIEVLNRDVTLAKGKPNSVFDADGSAIVIHAKADDYKSDPAGNAGDRIACGVVN